MTITVFYVMYFACLAAIGALAVWEGIKRWRWDKKMNIPPYHEKQSWWPPR